MRFIVIPYIKDGHAEAASRNPHLKLLFTLVGFEVADKSESSVLPSQKIQGKC